MQDVTYRILRTNRKTVALRFVPTGELEVRCPKKISQQEIESIIQKHLGWIEKQKKRLTSCPSFQADFDAHTRLYYLGESYPLQFTSEKHVAWTGEAFLLPRSTKSIVQKMMEEWYKQQARKLLTERTQRFAQQYGFSYKGIKITSAKYRFGSCSAKNNLNFTWRLILLPMELIDYIVVHELVHTKEKHHQKKFWKAVEAILPDYRERNQRIKSRPLSSYWF